jgi:hypothetical protein
MTSAPETWTAAQRARANVAAMQLVADLARAPRPLTAQDREALRAYSGWGGLSLAKLAPRFPEGVPPPDARQLIHDYYTPQAVWDAVARAVFEDLSLSDVMNDHGRIIALEPSVGIGRALSAFAAVLPDEMEWHAVEYSNLSATLFRALFPSVDLHVGPFEEWVVDHGAALAGKLGLVVSNPPYGERGAAKTKDPEREYRGPVDDAYAYFLRRALDLLKPNGLGVFLIPSAFLTGTAKEQVELRRLVLRRHHLSAAFRLPSGLFAGATAASDRGKVSTFGRILNTDLLFFRARGGELPHIDGSDAFIVDGDYYAQFPHNVLGREVGGRYGKPVEPLITSPMLGERGDALDVSRLDRPLTVRFARGAVAGDTADVYVTDAGIHADAPVPGAHKVGAITGADPTALRIDPGSGQVVILVRTGGTAERTIEVAPPAYQIVGEFDGLPREIKERPVCTTCEVQPLKRGRRASAASDAAPAAPPAADGGAPVAASTAAAQNAGLDHRFARAAALGRRARKYLAAVAAQDLEVPALAWRELHEALSEWAKQAGPPSLIPDLLRLAKANNDIQQFIALFERGTTQLIPALRTKPVWEPRYRGRSDDVVALAEWTYRQRRSVTRADLGKLDPGPLFAAGWAEDEGRYYPERIYYYGDLWPKYDRAKLRGDLGETQAAAQASKLLTAINPALFDDIDGVSPRQGWVPLSLIEEWLAPANIGGKPPKLDRSRGVIEVEGKPLEEASDATGVSVVIEMILAWINHNRGEFRPKTPEKKFGVGDFAGIDLGGDPDGPKVVGRIVKITRYGGSFPSANIEADGAFQFEMAVEDQPNVVVNAGQIRPLSLDEMRLAYAAFWERSFREWIAQDAGRRAQIELAYHRTFQGYRAPRAEVEPLPIARWAGPPLHDYQTAAVRRVLEQRGGLIGHDVGLGKTYEGLAAVAMARQEGWARRPIIIAPGALAWKWLKDARNVLPDYAVEVIGSKRKLITRGPRKGLITSEPDTPAERATKWSRFMGGEYDFVILTESAVPRTRMSDRALQSYVIRKASIRRQMILRKRTAKKRTSEREDAVRMEGVAGWVAELFELPEGWKYDPGITWEDLGIDFVAIDEMHRNKNRDMPEEREGGLPKYMGNTGTGSARAWQLDARLSTVRAKTGGAGVLGLTATPWKNGPHEAYVAITYIDDQAFARRRINNLEEYIDRYILTEMREVIDASGELDLRSAVVGFKNLHELRDIFYQYADIKTAEDVGLPLPEAKPTQIKVDLDARQESKFVRYLERIREFRKNPAKGNPLGYMARLNLVAIHPDLDEGYGWRDEPGREPKFDATGRLLDPGKRAKIDARKIENPHSPKFDALAAQIKAVPGCGHIVFIDTVAAHVWIKMVLIEAGIPEERIAILNAESVKGTDERLRVAERFNGVPAMINGEIVSDLSKAGPDDVVTEPVEPVFDVLIANEVAYEGVDLQRHTCMVHHLDLPYEPATLNQRNGRAVRQGSKREAMPINYYIANRSLDGFRFGLIYGKRGWMEALIKGSARTTNNPGAAENISIEDVLIELTRDPEEAAALRALQIRARQEAQRRKVGKAAVATLRAAAGRYALARDTADTMRAGTLRADAEKLLAQLADVDPKAWPWKGWAAAVAEYNMLVPTTGAPVYETLRVGYPDPVDPSRLQFLEFGKTDGQVIGARRAGSATWTALKVPDLGKYDLRPEHREVAEKSWPAEDESLATSLRTQLRNFYQGPEAWTRLGWAHATDAFVDSAWERFGAEIVTRMETLAASAMPFRAPVLFDDGVVGFGLMPRAGRRYIRLFPPTVAGWEEFLRAAVAGDKLPGSAGRAAIFETGQWWWGRRVPRDLFRAAEFAEALDDLRRGIEQLDAAPSGEQASASDTVIRRAISATMLGPLDDALMARVAQALATIRDDGVFTKGAGVERVQGLISLRTRAEAMASATKAPASARAPASAKAPASALPAATSTRPTPASLRALPALPTAVRPAASVRPASLRVVPPPPPSSVRPSARALLAEDDEDDDLAGALELDEDFMNALELDDEDDLSAALELDDEEDLTAALALD